jgi:uncharacterized protein
LEDARDLAVNASLVIPDTPVRSVSARTEQIIVHLGYIQIDTISVVERAHHHTLWVRQPDYQPAMLHELLCEKRTIFEYWGHAASYLPMADYRYTLPLKQAYRNPSSKWVNRQFQACKHLMEPILDRIRREGALSSRDFESPPGIRRGPWWDWKPAKMTLEMLFWQGELMISERRNFQRVYDLTERVLPDYVDTRIPDGDEVGRFLVRRALNAHGIAREKDIRRHLAFAGKNGISATIRDLLDAGEIIPVHIDTIPKTVWYVFSRKIESDKHRKSPIEPVVFLSPFDNAVIQRNRVRDLFCFDYVLECYLPASKRKYGYFCLPILRGNRFIGRVDIKAARKSSILIIHHLYIEDTNPPDDDMLAALARCIWNFAEFNACCQVKIIAVSPPGCVVRLRRLVKQAVH